MIEYDEDKLGKIKVLNVTEARANFSNVLKDGSRYYVITKNNKPIRAIINYEDFEALKGFVERGEYTPELKETFSGLDFTPRKKRKSRVKGMLSENTELSDQIKQKPPLPGLKPKKKKAVAKKPESKPKKKEVAVSEEIQQAINGGDDYFSVETEDQDFELISPEQTETFVEGYDMSAEEVEESIKQKFYDGKQKAEPAVEETEEVKVSPEDGDTPEEDRSPEEQEYFNKYKKLYESFSSAETEEEGGSENQSDDYFTSDETDDTYEEYEDEIDGEQEDIAAQESTQKPAKRTASQNPNDPPSLKDLLSDLEAEKISGEGEDLDEKEIDDLIHRITHDY